MQNKNIIKWVFIEGKIKIVSLKPINTYCGPKQSHHTIEDLERHCKRWESEIGECLSELRGDLVSAAHTRRAAHWENRTAHTVQKHKKNCKPLQILGKASRTRDL